MSVVIVGGHARMACQYTDVCKKHGYKAKVYTQPETCLDKKIGQASLVVLFTNPVSHKMAKLAITTAARKNITLVRSHSGSQAALENILVGAK